MDERDNPPRSPADHRADAPATRRNRQPLLDVLRDYMPNHGRVLEIAAGTGQHAVFFGRHFPGLTWFPTDPDTASRRSIDAWRAAEGSGNVQRAQHLDVSDRPWPVASADVVVCINMIHIAPWHATIDLMRGVRETLAIGGLLVTYGPYNVDDAFTSPSNERFDGWLKARDPSFGIRDIARVARIARVNRLELQAFVPMPAHNFTAVFERK